MGGIKNKNTLIDPKMHVRKKDLYSFVRSKIALRGIFGSKKKKVLDKNGPAESSELREGRGRREERVLQYYSCS